MSGQLHDIQQKMAQYELDRWLTGSLFTWQWWVLLALLFVPWFLLFRLIDRRRAYSIWFYGLTVLIATSFTDDLGAEIGIWVYPIKLAPYSLIGFPFDFSIVPVAQMLMFQYFGAWRSFLMALTAQALVFAFIGEPLSVKSELITYYGWTYAYSFLFYMITGVSAKAFVHYWAPKNQ
ncbi:DUF2070 family protein [Paenibacillus soyae]|uniref:DUF2070 family protein n=1 Tax=Paenibacillus soyae TaxID=2969249 RepID=A0A9X2MRZ3_9BACL|nr:DUF2070 family protein [Paenibacillus soyae]MCR2805781.1 DUF2070 family protein [Paenibacillus soyae]